MKKILNFCFISLIIFVPMLAHGAEISVVSSYGKDFSAGDKFQIDISLDTQGEAVNAFSGSVVFPKKLLDLSEVRDGNSIVNFWIEQLKLSNISEKNGDAIISFSGITPGGYVGGNGHIISLIFMAKEAGSGIISLKDLEILRNDGKGTSIKSSAKNFPFSVVLGQNSKEKISEIDDKDSPENFKPALARDPNLFDNKWFVVFATSDKGSGIDRYEISEKRHGLFFDSAPSESEWIVSESPYLLKDQSRKSEIYIKAIDKKGNEQLAVIHTIPTLRYTLLALLAIIAGVVVARRRLKRASFHE